MNAKKTPDREYLMECFEYNSEDGTLTWKFRPLGHFKTLGAKALIDKRDAGKVAGHVTRFGYRVVRANGASHMAHRIIWKIVHNEDPDEIDHINGRKDDNRIANLRAVLMEQNKMNKKMYKNNSSGQRGVGFDKGKGKWIAYIRAGSRRVHLGTYAEMDEAIQARLSAEKEIFGEYAHENHK